MKVVLSASRRTDLVASHPMEFIRKLDEFPPDRVHSIVLWTKDARNLLRQTALRETLSSYEQLFLQFSITGMGGGPLEPGIPETEQSLACLPGLIHLVGTPDRISLRYDPIVNLRMGEKNYTNLEEFPRVAKALSKLGIKRVTTSWMTQYKKVSRRFTSFGIEPIPFDWKKQADFLLEQCDKNALSLHACCVEGLPGSRCIDGPVLEALHPRAERCSRAKASGQRPLCGCTASKDIGWYSQVCGGGCLYCYASPADLSPRISKLLVSKAQNPKAVASGGCSC